MRSPKLCGSRPTVAVRRTPPIVQIGEPAVPTSSSAMRRSRPCENGAAGWPRRLTRCPKRCVRAALRSYVRSAVAVITRRAAGQSADTGSAESTSLKATCVAISLSASIRADSTVRLKVYEVGRGFSKHVMARSGPTVLASHQFQHHTMIARRSSWSPRRRRAEARGSRLDEYGHAHRVARVHVGLREGCCLDVAGSVGITAWVSVSAAWNATRRVGNAWRRFASLLPRRALWAGWPRPETEP
jgi:hypothetical protein